MLAIGLLGIILGQRAHGVGGFKPCHAQFDQVVELASAGALGLFLVASLARNMLGLNGLERCGLSRRSDHAHASISTVHGARVKLRAFADNDGVCVSYFPGSAVGA